MTDLTSLHPEERQNLCSAGMRAFLRICEAWKLDKEEQKCLLGAVSAGEYEKWKDRRNDDLDLPDEVLERISCVLGIYRALHIILPEAEAADGWLRRPNDSSFFNKKPAMERLLSGQLEDLYSVREYLDSSKT